VENSFTDTDQSTPISEFAKFIPLFEQGKAIVIGSRPSRPGAPLFRQILALGMVVLRTGLQLPYRDTQCGLTTESAQNIFRHEADSSAQAIAAHHQPGFDLGYRRKYG
jgi:hypothetical protein